MQLLFLKFSICNNILGVFCFVILRDILQNKVPSSSLKTKLYLYRHSKTSFEESYLHFQYLHLIYYLKWQLFFRRKTTCQFLNHIYILFITTIKLWIKKEMVQLANTINLVGLMLSHYSIKIQCNQWDVSSVVLEWSPKLKCLEFESQSYQKDKKKIQHLTNTSI